MKLRELVLCLVKALFDQDDQNIRVFVEDKDGKPIGRVTNVLHCNGFVGIRIEKI